MKEEEEYKPALHLALTKDQVILLLTCISITEPEYDNNNSEDQSILNMLQELRESITQQTGIA